MRTLKYAILGLINREPLTGYDITKKFSDSIGNFWAAKHSQIYPELKKLAEEKLIVCDIKIAGEVLEKKLYSITPKGREDFLSWVAMDEPMTPPPKDVFRLRMYFAESIVPAHRQTLLDQQVLKHEAKLQQLVTTMSAYAKVPSQEAALGDYLLLDGAILREKAYITWLHNVLRITNNRN